MYPFFVRHSRRNSLKARSKARAFLYTQKKSRLLCMGRTSTAVKPFPTNNSPKPIRGSWESNPARVKASKNFNIQFKYSKYA
jgi:hypothetical protein